MVRQKIVDRYNFLTKKIEALRESDILDGVEYGPTGLFSSWPTGMPRGTNDREAATFQRSDVNDGLNELEKLENELEMLLQYVERSGITFA